METANETCGYCGQRRDDSDWVCPNTADAYHSWESEPWKTEAICEREHAEAGYPTEQQAQERELARIYWQKEEVRNELRALRAKEWQGLDELRAKLTSWPAMFSKRYEVARALALGWVYQFRLDLVAVAIAILLVVVCGWLSVR